MEDLEMVMLGEIKLNGTEGASEENDMERFKEIVKISRDILMSIVVLAQIITTSIYISKTKKVEEISKFTKLMMVTATIAGLLFLAVWTGHYFELDDYIASAFVPISRVL